MRKLKLDMDQLQVETFDTAADRADERGTVRGHAWTLLGCGYGSWDAPAICDPDQPTVTRMYDYCECLYTEGLRVETCFGDCHTQWGTCEACTA